MSAKLPAALVTVAQCEIGVKEIGNTNCGLRVNEYKAATNLPAHEAWAWCAAFVCWCVREAAELAKVEFTDDFKRPTTAGARAFEDWSLAQDDSTQTKKPHRGDIKPGDIVVFGKISHIGIAISSPNKNGYVTTVEGNTNGAGSRDGGAVLKKTRHMTDFRSRIRFTV